jgi:hypothetical protein
MRPNRQIGRATHPEGMIWQPCSGRGLPPFPVTRVGCALLPHSFHPYRDRALTRHHAAVSFLWHFPYSRLRLPLATVLLCAVRTFLTTLADRAIIFWSDVKIMP